MDDGLHFNGPIQYLTINGVKLRTWDDGIALNANDAGVDDLTLQNTMGPYVGQGPIKDVVISNVTFMDSHHGFRILSSNQLIDRILIQNVIGTIRERFVVISHFVNPSPGRFGSISFNNISVQTEPHPAWRDLHPEYYTSESSKPWMPSILEEGELPLFSLNGPMDHLQLNNVTTIASDRRPVIRVGPDASIDTLKVDLSIIDPKGLAVPVGLIGRIKRFRLALDWNGSAPIRYEGGTIDQLNFRQEDHNEAEADKIM